MSKTLSISYCGGCNAGYDRVAFIQEVLARVRNAGVTLEIVEPAGESDMAVVLAGCQALCVAEREDMGGRARVRHVVGPGTLDAVSMPFAQIQDRLVTELIG